MSKREMGEFDLIKRYFAPLSVDAPGAFGLTDDAALLPPLGHGEAWVVTTDTMAERSHWLAGSAGSDVAAKLLRVNLSDLASMGAKPRFYTLALALNHDTPEDWVRDFAEALGREQETFSVSLIGGDTIATSGRVSATLTAFGSIGRGAELRRSGASVGDGVYVTGTIGDAALGLMALRGALLDISPDTESYLVGRHRLPEPRMTVGLGLAGVASACVDVSDGLVQDMGHIAAASNVSIEIEMNAIPLSDAARAVLEKDPANMETVLSGGDDYELAFTVPAGFDAALSALSKKTAISIGCIGRVKEGSGVSVRSPEGLDVTPKKGGFQHF